MNRWFRLLKHRWMDASDSRRAISDLAAERLARLVAASEASHTGQIRICVEAALPTSYLLRIGHNNAMSDVVRQRALTWFGRLRVWDTEHNNGVLIYLLLAEHAIEFVADRSLAREVDTVQWAAAVQRLGQHLRDGAFEAGLVQAVDEVTALLRTHHPRQGLQDGPNELPDAVVRT